MKSYNFNSEKMIIILENFNEILDIKNSIYSASLTQKEYIKNASDPGLKQILSDDLKNINFLQNTLENGKNCNEEIIDYIYKECEAFNIDPMQFINICIKSYMQQCDIAKELARKGSN